MIYKLFFFVSVFLGIFYSCNNSNGQQTQVKDMQVKVINKFNHNEKFFSQGFYFEDNKIYEGLGQFGQSGLCVYELNDNKKIIQSNKLSKEFFGEGITVFNNKIYQLTWKNHKCFVYDKNTLVQEKEFYLPTEGWGITHNDTALIISDGTNNIYYYNPIDFSLIKSVPIFENNEPVIFINELEYVDGILYANKWTRNEIIAIDLTTQNVVAKIDCTELINKNGLFDENNVDKVLNGIAYNKANKHFYITGKLWPYIFEIELIKN